MSHSLSLRPCMAPLRDHVAVPVAVGVMETLIEIPDAPIGLALVAHPHPLGGGANNNKVVFTLAKALLDLGYITLRPNFRGVGKSSGVHDQGDGESDDLYQLLHWARARFFADKPSCALMLAGFSFGAYCQTRLYERLQGEQMVSEFASLALTLVGTAVGSVVGLRHYNTPAVPANSLLIHGSDDEIVPLAQVLPWAEQHRLALNVIPGADHFLTSQLSLMRLLVLRHWLGAAALAQGTDA